MFVSALKRYLFEIPSPRKLRILLRNENTSSLTPKNGMNASVQNRDVTYEDLNDVILLIQNNMQALTTFEKQFIPHKDIETTH